MDFSFFTEDNKSGYKTRENWLSKNHPDLYFKIIQYSSKLDINLSFKEKILFFYQNRTERPKCVTCGNEVKFRERFDKPYGEFCSLTCINENKNEMINRQIKTFQKKYGVDFYPEHEEFIIKQKQTKKLKYGDENYSNIEKQKKTKEEKYGNKNYNNIDKNKLTCLKKYGVDNYSKSNNYQNRLKKEFKEKYKEINIIDVYKTNIKALCNKCGLIYEINKQLIYERYNRNYDVCTICNPIGQFNVSGYEKELSKYLNELNVEHEVSNRKIIKKELDIYIPKNKLAIEINGVYWHSELFLDSDYHLNKTIMCQDNGIELIHIFEDEWLYKKDIVKSIIKNRLGLVTNKIFARKTRIVELNSNQTKEFLEQNHIQGNVNSKVRIGLIYENKIVSVMTFSKGRILMGGKKDEWELTRFANIIDYNVIGAADKLLKYFIKKYTPNKIVSYSDIRLFNGNMYKKLGFLLKSQSKPNYWYVHNNLRYHRFNFRKSVLINEGYDKNKTEKEIMFERKYYRIYDCGNVRWEFHLH